MVFPVDLCSSRSNDLWVTESTASKYRRNSKDETMTLEVHQHTQKSSTYTDPASFLRFFWLRVHVNVALGSNPCLVCRGIVVRYHRICVLDLPSPQNNADSTIARHQTCGAIYHVYTPTITLVFFLHSFHKFSAFQPTVAKYCMKPKPLLYSPVHTSNNVEATFHLLPKWLQCRTSLL